MVLLDRGTTLYYFQVLNKPVELERNLVVRFILEKELWSYYIFTTVWQICVMVVIVKLFFYGADKIDKNYIMVFPLLLSSIPVVNNTIVLLFG